MRTTLWRRSLLQLILGTLLSCTAKDAPPKVRGYGTTTSALTVMPNRGINDRGFQRQGRYDPQQELTVAAYQNIVAAAFMDCSGRFDPTLRGGSVGWAFSSDSGNSWKDLGPLGALQKDINADFGATSDPALDVDAGGNFYLVASYQRSDQSSRLAVYKGGFDPGSQTIVWNRPTLLQWGDRPYFGIDRANGYIYLAYARLGIAPAGIYVTRSTNAGTSWDTPVLVSSDSTATGPIPRVGPDGEVYIAWLSNYQSSPKQVTVTKSPQGQWPSFTQPTVVATVKPIRPSAYGLPNSTSFPTLAVVSSGPARGRVYLVWTDGRFDGNPGPQGGFSAIAFSYSSNGTWSDPAQVNDDGDPTITQTHHWQPWTSGAPDGTVYVGWYDRRLRCVGCTTTSCDARTDVYAASFTVAGGVNPNVRLTDQTFSMDVPGESDCFPSHFGYNGAFATSDHFYFVWSDGRNGDPDAFGGGLVLP